MSDTIDAHELKSLEKEAIRLEDATKHVLGMQITCWMEGRSRPGDEIVRSYADLLPALETIRARIGEIAVDAAPDYSLPGSILRLQAITRRLLARMNIIYDWLRKDDGSDDGHEGAPMRPMPLQTYSTIPEILAI